jgi:UDP-N-acetylglucosamine 2-epimerase (non-hydrolysing)
VIAFVVGTTAELIKIAPVFHACVARGATCAIWFTSQHVEAVPDLLKRLDLPEPQRYLARGIDGHDLHRPRDVPRWVWQLLRTVVPQRARLRRELTADGRVPLVVVHGDTFTCVVGALLGRFLRVDVAHVEAGLRSGSWRSPFPEELNRRVTARLVDLHFAPTSVEVANVAGRGTVVLTEANTVVDSLKLLREAASGDLPPRSYGVVTLHRFELLRDAVAFRQVLELLAEAAGRTPLVFFAGAQERERIDRLGLRSLFSERFSLRSKASYVEFLPILAGASFVVTDSGGLQEECAYLGLPCAVHRERTERRQGLGRNVVLTGLDLEVLSDFLRDPCRFRRDAEVEQHHPSEVIADTLHSLGHL